MWKKKKKQVQFIIIIRQCVCFVVDLRIVKPEHPTREQFPPPNLTILINLLTNTPFIELDCCCVTAAAAAAEEEKRRGIVQRSVLIAKYYLRRWVGSTN